MTAKLSTMELGAERPRLAEVEMSVDASERPLPGQMVIAFALMGLSGALVGFLVGAVFF